MEIILKYFPALSSLQIDQFTMLGRLYPEWNAGINVISRKDIANLYEKHILHSLAIARFLSFGPGCRIMDAGTGGGFPGIPLAILFPEARFNLVDSTAKKLKVVNEIAMALKLMNVETRHSRLEEIDETYDFVVSRAVATIPQMLIWTGKNIRPGQAGSVPNGLLYLKGGDFSEELRSVKQAYTLYNLSDIFKEEFFETKKLVHVIF